VYLTSFKGLYVAFVKEFLLAFGLRSVSSIIINPAELICFTFRVNYLQVGGYFFGFV
jgi:hypothetical protein